MSTYDNQFYLLEPLQNLFDCVRVVDLKIRKFLRKDIEAPAQ